MGAFSTLCAFDHAALRDVVAPAVRRLLATGELGVLAPYWQTRNAWALQSETRFAAHYATHARASDSFEALRNGLGIDLSRHCQLLDDELGLRPMPLSAMADVRPSAEGACPSQTCSVRLACPMHVAQGGPASAEEFGDVVKDAVYARCCVADPPDVLLGRHGTLFTLASWYLAEQGIDGDQSDEPFTTSSDPLVGLLVRLSMRARAWGWDDGGFGEGLLGWLSPVEASELTAALGAYDLADDAPWPPSLDAERIDELAHVRGLVRAVRDHAGACARHGLGVLLRRD